MAESAQERKRRGTEDSLGRALNISREKLLEVLARSPSIRSASQALNANHQGILDVIRYDKVFQSIVEEGEKNYVEQWPRSATESYLCQWDWLHSLLQKRSKRILERDRWKGCWPDVIKMCDLFGDSYPVDRWEGLTVRRNLLLASGLPKIYREAMLVGLTPFLEGIKSGGDWKRSARQVLKVQGWRGGWPGLDQIGQMFLRAFSTEGDKRIWQDDDKRINFLRRSQIPERLWPGVENAIREAAKKSVQGGGS
jgi:hypothetical protein